MKEKRITLLNDLGFKKAMATPGNEDVLGGLFADFFGRNPGKIVIDNPYSISDYTEMMRGEDVKTLRQTLRDVTASVEVGSFICELQINRTLFFEERAFYYAFNRYCQGYNGAEAQGEGLGRYASIKPVFALNILGYNHFVDDDDALRFYQLCDFERGKRYAKDLLKIGFFELRKDQKLNENQRYWHSLFLTGKAEKGAPYYIQKASELMNYVNLSREEQVMADILEKAIATEEAERLYVQWEATQHGLAEGRAAGLAEGRAEGRVEGLAEGLAEGRTEGRTEMIKETVFSLLSKKVEASFIVEVLHISESQLKEYEAEYMKNKR